ncbi:MAG TPA: acyl-CoA dehydrogenase family protein [Steroidobacteraceae bacterium]|nr:acyl-CoA dehydrogenase family protein [Steroidobacteraceae bacterium]
MEFPQAVKHSMRLDLLARVKTLAPLLAANARRTDEEGLIPQENLDALRQADLLALGRPSKYGGLETDLRTLLEVQVAIAESCGSTSWVAGLGNVSSFLLGLFPAEAQEDVWGMDKDSRAAVVVSPAGSSATKVADGWRISGKWRYASGSEHAQWAVVGVSAPADGGKPDIGLALVPMSEVRIERNWNVTGLCGTGSNTMVLDNVFVPSHRQLSYQAAVAGEAPTPYDTDAHPLYRTPFSAIFNLCIAATPVGLAKAAVKLAIATAPKQIIPIIGVRQSEAPSIQIIVANAACTADSAELHLFRAAAAADQAALLGMPQSPLDVARSDADRVMAARYAIEAVRLIVKAQMSSVHSKTNPMQLIWRDCEMAASHFAFADLHLEAYGKAMFNQQ